uniref:Glycoside hydrolase family 38 N-terminal domain-containing protein n=1 Tax=Ananas comosus var. bracteatus TaxID=296719 RepID=A0A6V7NP83_ANACO|nr:unnamed protein product [Ananas comosus var. bracteatus]
MEVTLTTHDSYTPIFNRSRLFVLQAPYCRLLVYHVALLAYTWLQGVRTRGAPEHNGPSLHSHCEVRRRRREVDDDASSKSPDEPTLLFSALLYRGFSSKLGEKLASMAMAHPPRRLRPPPLPPPLLLLPPLLFLLLLARVAESKYIAYNTTGRIVPDKLNVHIVAHSHDDVGWLKTVDQYYVGSNNSIQGACVQNVLDSLVPALLKDKNRKFIYVEQAFFQRWWRQQSNAIQQIVKELVSSGQLELINGGMCMHDEAAVHYIDMIDQTTLGHQFIKQEFNQTPRIGWQIDPFGHSAVQAYLLGAEVGFDALYFSRIDYQDRAKRKDLKTLEIVWRGSRSLGSSADIFTVNDVSPVIQDDVLLFDFNVEERVNDFVAAAVSQANITRLNHVMFTMGTDFKYQYAESWFRQLDKFIHYVNKDGRVNALYSTPSIYTDAKHAANESWPIKTDDFFPYADDQNSYWTGYFTSRPALKVMCE